MKKTNKTRYAVYDEADWEKVYFDEQTKGFVVIHKGHGKGERVGNFAIAKRLANLGFMVELLPISAGKSVDSCINEEFWEFKMTSGSMSSVQSRLREGKFQCEKILLVPSPTFQIGELLRGVISAVNVDKARQIQEVGLLIENEFIRLLRGEILKRDFTKLEHYF